MFLADVLRPLQHVGQGGTSVFDDGNGGVVQVGHGSRLNGRQGAARLGASDYQQLPTLVPVLYFNAAACGKNQGFARGIFSFFPTL